VLAAGVQFGGDPGGLAGQLTTETGQHGGTATDRGHVDHQASGAIDNTSDAQPGPICRTPAAACRPGWQVTVKAMTDRAYAAADRVSDEPPGLDSAPCPPATGTQ
jgi:hypothetical protein